MSHNKYEEFGANTIEEEKELDDTKESLPETDMDMMADDSEVQEK